jgi:hypothetical protein
MAMSANLRFIVSPQLRTEFDAARAKRFRKKTEFTTEIAENTEVFKSFALRIFNS